VISSAAREETGARSAPEEGSRRGRGWVELAATLALLARCAGRSSRSGRIEGVQHGRGVAGFVAEDQRPFAVQPSSTRRRRSGSAISGTSRRPVCSAASVGDGLKAIDAGVVGVGPGGGEQAHATGAQFGGLLDDRLQAGAFHQGDQQLESGPALCARYARRAPARRALAASAMRRAPFAVTAVEDEQLGSAGWRMTVSR
jgi:hypothetical protein